MSETKKFPEFSVKPASLQEWDAIADAAEEAGRQWIVGRDTCRRNFKQGHSPCLWIYTSSGKASIVSSCTVRGDLRTTAEALDILGAKTPDEPKEFRSFKVDLRNESPEMVERLKVAVEAFGYSLDKPIWPEKPQCTLICQELGIAKTRITLLDECHEARQILTLTEALEYLEGKPAVENTIEHVAEFVASQVPVNSASYHDFIDATRVAIAQSMGLPAHVWWDPAKPETEKTMSDKKEKALMTITIPPVGKMFKSSCKWCVKGVWTVLKDSVGLAVRWTLAAGLIASAGAYAEAKLGAVSYVISLVETLGM